MKSALLGPVSMKLHGFYWNYNIIRAALCKYKLYVRAVKIFYVYITPNYYNIYAYIMHRIHFMADTRTHTIKYRRRIEILHYYYYYYFLSRVVRRIIVVHSQEHARARIFNLVRDSIDGFGDGLEKHKKIIII